MSSIEEIEDAISRLPTEHLAELRAWFADFDARSWDRQIERDADEGRLDALAEEALVEDKADRPPTPPRRKAGLGRLSLRLALLMIVVVAGSLWGYRRWAGYETPKTWTYPVADLVPGEGTSSFQSLIDEITTTIQPGTWAEAGGGGTVTPFLLSRSLIIKSNLIAHQEIAQLLEKKRVEMGKIGPDSVQTSLSPD